MVPPAAPVGEVALVAAKSLLFHLACLGDEERYLSAKSRLMLAAGRLGAYERACMRLLPFFIRPGAVAVDVGANFGVYTHTLAALVGRSGRVVAFEPVPPVAAFLERSCAGLANVAVFREALSDGRREMLELQVPRLWGGVPEPALARVDSAAPGPRQLRTWHTFHVRARRLDDHLASLRDVVFIKADVEAHEAEFLAGADRTIRTFRPIVQVESVGIALHRSVVLNWSIDNGYMLCNLLRGRLCRTRDGEGLSPNVYLVPAEARASLPRHLFGDEDGGR